MSPAVDTAGIRSAVTALPGVVRVHGRGPNGVSADESEVEVHVVARYGEVLPDLGAQLDRELAPLLGGRTLRLVVDDVAVDDDSDDPDDPDDEPAALPAGTTPVAALPPGGDDGDDA